MLTLQKLKERKRGRKKEIYRQKERETDSKRFTNLIGWENRDGNTGKPRGQMTSGDKTTFTNGFDLFDSVVDILVYVIIKKEREKEPIFSQVTTPSIELGTRQFTYGRAL